VDSTVGESVRHGASGKLSRTLPLDQGMSMSGSSGNDLSEHGDQTAISSRMNEGPFSTIEIVPGDDRFVGACRHSEFIAECTLSACAISNSGRSGPRPTFAKGWSGRSAPSGRHSTTHRHPWKLPNILGHISRLTDGGHLVDLGKISQHQGGGEASIRAARNGMYTHSECVRDNPDVPARLPRNRAPE